LFIDPCPLQVWFIVRSWSIVHIPNGPNPFIDPSPWIIIPWLPLSEGSLSGHALADEGEAAVATPASRPRPRIATKANAPKVFVFIFFTRAVGFSPFGVSLPSLKRQIRFDHENP
jgi:hypothetical protein